MNHAQKNIDPEEVAKFDALADQWWDPEGPMKPLHGLNPYRLQYVLNHTSLTHKKVCDIGCGAGILTESLAKSGAITTGIDLSSKAISIAKHHAKENNLTIEYECMATEAFAKQHPEKFDVITCMEMLEHVPDPAAIISAAKQMVKPGGYLFFSTINRNPKAFLSAIVGAEYILRLLPRGTHTYEKFIKPSELTRMAKTANLTLCDMTGLSYNPLTQKFALTDNVNINYLITFQRQA